MLSRSRGRKLAVVAVLTMGMPVLFRVSELCAASAFPYNYIVGTPVMKPTYGTPPNKGDLRTDGTTGMEIVRASSHGELTPASPYGLVVYPRYTPSNVSGEYVLVHHADSTSCSVYRVADWQDLGVLRRDATHPIGEVNEIRWDYTGANPTRVYFVSGVQFWQMEVISGNGTPELIRDFSTDFPGSVKIINDVEGDSSNDSRFWAWQVLGPYTGGKFPRLAIFVYDKENNEIVGRLLPERFGRTYLPAPNMVEVSPLGTKVITHYGAATTRPCSLPGPWTSVGNGTWQLVGYKALTAGNNVFGRVTVGEIALANVGSSSGSAASITADNQYSNNSGSDTFWIRPSGGSDPNGQTVVANWGSRPEDVGTGLDAPRAWDLSFVNPVVISADETHSGWAWDSMGRELFVSQNNKQDWIETRDILDGQVTQILQHGVDLAYSNGFHFGKIYDRSLRGWLLMNTTSKTNNHWSENQVLMVEVKKKSENPIIWRVSPKYAAYAGNYRDESPVALGYDGITLWHTGNWGVADGTGDVYEYRLPVDWYEHFPGPLHPPRPLRAPRNLRALQ